MTDLIMSDDQPIIIQMYIDMLGHKFCVYTYINTHILNIHMYVSIYIHVSMYAT